MFSLIDFTMLVLKSWPAQILTVRESAKIQNGGK